MKHLILLSFLFISFHAQCQKSHFFERLKGSSIGLFYNNNSSFNLGLKFRTAKGKTVLLKGNSFQLQTNEFDNIQAAFGTQAFLLKDYELTEKFFISHGFGTGISANSSWNQGFVNFNGLIDLIYRTEFNYRINEDFTLGVALNPTIRFSSSVNNNLDLNYQVLARASQSSQLYCFYTI